MGSSDFLSSPPKLIIFDFCNTLISFGPEEIQEQTVLLKEALLEWFGPFDEAQLIEVRNHQILYPFNHGYKERSLLSICEELIQELYPNQRVCSSRVSKLVDLRISQMIDAMKISSKKVTFLNQLAQQYPLALLSNFPSAYTIRESLKNLGIYELFHKVVISEDLGWAKPHPDIFKTLFNQVGVSPEECLLVGDNWIADVQGGKKAGLRVIHSKEFISFENFLPQKDDFLPDGVINELTELGELLALPPSS